jgi:ring-1,2-phenylacetyl-CoA epoxidase subunit PaaA
VINGNGPCNKERLAARIKAHEDGAWVREAALVFAAKQKKKNSDKEVKLETRLKRIFNDEF